MDTVIVIFWTKYHNKVCELIIYTHFFFLFFVASNRVGGWNGLLLQPKYQTFMTVAVS